MQNPDALRTMAPRTMASQPRLFQAADLNGDILRAGPTSPNRRLEDLFKTLESSECKNLTLLHRPDGTLVSAMHSEVIDGHKCLWELIRLSDDLFVRTSNCEYEQSTVFPISGEGLIELHFRQSGRLSLSDESEPDTNLKVDCGSLLIWRQPDGHDVTGRLDTSEREASLTIYLRPSVLAHYFGEFAQTLPEALTQRLCCQGGSLFALRLTPFPRLTQLVHELLALNCSGPLRLVQVEALVMLVMCEVVAMLREAPHDAVAGGRITDVDVRCLRQARAILQERYTNPPTIEYLARSVGLGTTKLKNGFKSLFGTTISQFTNDIRMEHACELLCKPDIPIAIVAETLGYGYQNSFTTAFRRHYGVLPKDYRRDPLILRLQ